MIFRRFLKRFRQQQWGAIATELVIVVIGVFIGMQAQDWATARAEQHRADVLLQQLRGDLDSEKAIVKMYLDYQQVTAAYARVAIRGLESPGSVDTQRWVASAYQASQITTAQSSRSTFDEMKSTGAIDLVRDARLRALLISYYSYDWTQSVTMTAQAPYRELVRSVLPYAIQKAVKASCGDRYETLGDLVTTRLPKTCHLDLPAADIAHAAEILRATPGLLPALTYQLSLTETNVETVEPTQRQLADVMAAAAKATP